MKPPRFLLIPLLFLSISALAQAGDERVNIRLSNEDFNRFAEQVEAQSDLVLYYKPEWFEGKRFTFSADSIVAEDALYEILKGTGLHFNRIGGTRLIILPQRRLNMSLPAMTAATGRYQETEGAEEYMGIKADQYLTGTRPEQITRTIEVGERGASVSRGVARVRGKLINVVMALTPGTAFHPIQLHRDGKCGCQDAGLFGWRLQGRYASGGDCPG
jgi:hypothetical protein